MAAVAVLCSVSYLLGIWHNGGPLGRRCFLRFHRHRRLRLLRIPHPKRPRRRGRLLLLLVCAAQLRRAPHRGGDGGGVHDGAAQVLLTTPTTPTERMKEISKASEEFVYLVSVVGVTGPRPNVNPHVKDLLQEIKQVTDKAVVVGFGISTPDDVRQIAEWGADGVIIGSAMVRQYVNQTTPTRLSSGRHTGGSKGSVPIFIESNIQR